MTATGSSLSMGSSVPSRSRTVRTATTPGGRTPPLTIGR
jgi:hypothetical protein